MFAALLGKPDVVKKLLEHGTAPSSQDVYQNTALHWAASGGCLDSASALIAAGAEPSTQGAAMYTPLIVACQKGHITMVSLLAKLETRRNVVETVGPSALHHAAVHQPDAFKLLLELGWDPYLQDLYGYSPICTGLRSRHLLSLVCNYGFDLMTLWTSRAATTYGNLLSIGPNIPVNAVRMLLKRLPQSLVTHLLETESIGQSIVRKPLCSAAQLGRIDIIEVLVDAGADIDGPNDSLGTPLIAATLAGQLEAVKILVRRGAEVFLRCVGRFPNAVHAALSTGREEVLQWLLAGRYTDQRRITDNAEDIERVIKPWSGICWLSVPIEERWKRLSCWSLWEYLLYMEEEKKTWQRMLPPDQIEKVSLVWEMPEAIIAPCISRCWVNTERRC